MRSSFFGIATLSALLALSTGQAALAGDLEEGAKLYAEKQYAKAIPLLERAAQFNPMSWKPHYYLANTNLALGRMAAAKYEYQLCLKTNPQAAIVARCNEGIARADKHSTQRAAASAASSSETPKEGGEEPKLTDAQVANKRRKEDVMKLAREQCTKIKQEAKDQVEHEKSHANEYFQDQDGRVFTDITDEREAEIHREADEKCRKIMQDAERKVRSIP